MNKKIKPIETYFNGYHFRSRLEARWAVFFSSLGLDYEYEIEGYQMDVERYLPDFYVPSLDRWFEIKGQPLNNYEIKKCEEFCYRKDNENIKFSILIGSPTLVRYKNKDISITGIKEFTWEWPSITYPSNTLILAEGLTKEEYYSRFIPAIWKVPNVNDKELIRAVKK